MNGTFNTDNGLAAIIQNSKFGKTESEASAIVLKESRRRTKKRKVAEAIYSYVLFDDISKKNKTNKNM